MIPLVVSLVLAAPAADPPKEMELPVAAQKELKKLEGKWKLVKEVSADGEREPEVVVEFKGRKLSLDMKEKKENFEFSVTALDPSTDPKCIDFTVLVEKGPLAKGTVIEAIYKLDGDTLTLVGYAGEGKKRPANFDPPKDEGAGMWVLKRVKE
jgi:uncharacterized protein (TIGR03067 family)